MEKYMRVFYFDESKYAVGCPIVICAGALLKDNFDGSIIAQLKFRNIGNKIIKELKVELTLFDSHRNEQEKKIEYKYMNLTVNRNIIFGSQEPIELPYKDTRYFDVKIKEILFEDDVLINENDNYKIIPELELLDNYFGDHNLLTQYILETSYKSKYLLKDFEDLWLCSCGNINHSNEDVCYICNVSKNQMKRCLNIDYLKKKTNDRLIDLERKKNKIKQILFKTLILFIIIFAVILCAFGINEYFFNNSNDNDNDIKETPIVEVNENVVVVNLFHWSECSHCQEEIEWLKEVEKRNDKIKVNYYEVTEYEDLVNQVRTELGIMGEGVPLTVIGSDYILGFSDSMKARIMNLVDKYQEKDYCDIVPLIENSEDTTNCYVQNS